MNLRRHVWRDSNTKRRSIPNTSRYRHETVVDIKHFIRPSTSEEEKRSVNKTLNTNTLYIRYYHWVIAKAPFIYLAILLFVMLAIDPIMWFCWILFCKHFQRISTRIFRINKNSNWSFEFKLILSNQLCKIRIIYGK